jgi:hypothetical protein
MKHISSRIRVHKMCTIYYKREAYITYVLGGGGVVRHLMTLSVPELYSVGNYLVWVTGYCNVNIYELCELFVAQAQKHTNVVCILRRVSNDSSNTRFELLY